MPEAEFADCYLRLREAGVRAFNEKPEWRRNSYWGYSVMDPMGNTVEVYTFQKYNLILTSGKFEEIGRGSAKQCVICCLGDKFFL
jgi:hypothetical protein